MALGKTVSELERCLSSYEMTEWMAFEKIQPFGDVRADFRAGIISSVIANVHRGKDRKAFSASDFMPFLDDPNKGADVSNTSAQAIEDLFESVGIQVIEKNGK